MLENRNTPVENRAWMLIERLGIHPREFDYLCHLVRQNTPLTINEAETQTLDFKDSIRSPIAYLTAALRKRSQ